MAVAFAMPARAQNSDFVGALLGGAGGAVAGAQFGQGKGRLVGTAVGALTGAMLGQSVGRSLDRGDAAYYGTRVDDGYYQPRAYSYYQPAPAYYRPAPRVIYSQPVYAAPAYYPPPPPQQVYYPPPQPEAASATGYCREYQAPIAIGGRKINGYGQACMQPDGSWQLGPLQPEQ